MPFGLPARDEANWDTKLNDSINAVKATADAAQPSATLDASVTAVDANAASALRVQQDARLSATYASSSVMRGAGIDTTGATDSSTAMQALITAAGVGANIYFPAGAVYKAINLVPLSGQTWWGWGTIKRAGGVNQTIITGTGVSDFHVWGLTIDGGKLDAVVATNVSGVLLNSFTRARFSEVTFQNMPLNNVALDLRAGIDCSASDCNFYNVGYGVLISLEAGQTDACYGNSVIGCTFDGVDLNPIFATENNASIATTVTGRVLDTTVVGNTMRNFGDAGIEIGSGCRGATVTGNTVNGLNTGITGILVRDAEDVTVVGNTVRNIGAPATNSDGIGVASLNDESANIHIAGNTVTGSARHGIFVNGSPVNSPLGANNVSGSGSADINVSTSPWIAPTLVNSWANNAFGFAPAGYRKDADGRVWIRGMIIGGATGTVAFTLPVGYRPLYPTRRMVNTNGAFGQATINTDGTVEMTNVTSAAWADFDELSFTLY